MTTIDKIRFYMDANIFEYWTSSGIPQREDIERAANELEGEINAGLLTDIKYHAELKLLKNLML